MHSPDRVWRRRRLPILVVLSAVAVLCVGAAGVSAGRQAAGPQGFTATPLSPDTTYSAAKSHSGGLAQTDPSLLGRTDAQPVPVMIKYDLDATASYAGDVAGLAATSPEVTGKPLDANKAAVAAYDAYATDKSQEISADVKSSVPAAAIGETFTTVYGGVRATVPANQVATLLQVPGVAAVQKDALAQPLDDNTAFIGATAVWPTLGGQDNAGKNVVVGVIDTGIWPESPFFADRGLGPAPGPARACQFGNGSDAANLGPAFACNDKLVGAYAFTSTYTSINAVGPGEFCNATTKVCSPRDPEGHGTHTSSTAAGSRVDSAVLYGVERGPVSGIAPGARVIMYRVCLAAGCYGSDSVAAVQQAIADDVDVINFSISGGAQPYSDPVELAFLDATNAGISVNASAGNSGPGSSTADHGGPWVTTVGASTGPRFFTSTLHLSADGGATFDMPGVTITNGISTPTPIVLAQNIPGEDVLCQSQLPAMAAAGKIVFCQRGTNARVDKGYNVFKGNAAGMVLYNPVMQDLETDNHWLPAIHVDGPPTALLAFINTHTNVMASWTQGIATATLPDMMASFSSRGPTGDWIKPDVTAPGVQVLAGMTPQPDPAVPTNGPPGNLFQAIAGTSMSSPHAAGVSALVKAAHPGWSPAQIKSALMTSSVQSVVKEDGVTPASVFDDGAGSIRADRAVSPTLVFDETYADFVAAGADPLHRVDLNLASVDATTMTGTVTTSRTATNVSGRHENLVVSIQQPAGVSIEVGNENRDLHIGKGETQTFPIKITATDVANGQYTARINLTPKSGSNKVTIPVAFVKRQGSVSLTHSCSPTTISTSEASHCVATVQNLGATAANASLSIAPVEKGKKLKYSNVTPPGVLVDPTTHGLGDGVTWSGTLTPALAPTVVAITPGGSPAGGYLPLSAFGIAPIAGVGDDTITNFNVPTFYYGGEPYTRVGVVSNGYVVIGGGDSGDVVFNPQTFPNANRPNNVVAPFWSDLNPAAAGAIRIGTLTDGTSTWLVTDWEGVKNYSNATTQSFQTWFRIGTVAPSESITLAYGTIGAGDPASGLNSGAENRNGSSGKNFVAASNTDDTVTLAPPTPGGQVTINFDVSSTDPSTYHSLASMTSDKTPGVTQVSQTIVVTP